LSESYYKKAGLQNKAQLLDDGQKLEPDGSFVTQYRLKKIKTECKVCKKKSFNKVYCGVKCQRSMPNDFPL